MYRQIMYRMIIGYIGMVIVVIAFLSLNTRFSKYFVEIDGIGTLIMLIHAIIIGDYPFILINCFVLGSLIFKKINGGIK